MAQLQIEINKIRDSGEVQRIEQRLAQYKGVNYVSMESAGLLALGWDADQTDQETIVSSIEELGLKIKRIRSIPTDDPHEHIPLHLRSFGDRIELYFAISSGVFWLLGITLSFFPESSEDIPTALFIIGGVFGGYFTLITTGKDLLHGKLEIDFLMLFAAVGAATLGKWGEGNLLLFLFSLGHALEHYAMKRARKSISDLSELAPAVALVKRNGKMVEVGVEQLEISDIIVVKPNSKIAADGVVIKGTSAVNQASITGESVPVDKSPAENWQILTEIKKIEPRYRVFAGTLNGNGALEVKVLKRSRDSTLSRLIALVREAEAQKSPTQLLTNKFEKYYVPFVLMAVLVLLFVFLVVDETFQQSFYRAMSVLIAASPCALAISTPSAVLAGIARAARQGVLIKGGRPLEDLGGLNAIAFDKTGTLTEGKPRLTKVIPYGNSTREELLKVVVAVEALSDHPLAEAIVEGAKKELGDVDIPEAENFRSITARGIRANWKGSLVHIGNRRLFEELTQQNIPEEIEGTMTQLESGGHTSMIIRRDKTYLGIVAVMDVARAEARSTLEALKNIGIRRMIMLTGDHQKVADAIAKDLHITDVMGSLLPEDKVAAIERLKLELGSVAMVGDGVNDAPAMAKSTVGIAMGAASSHVALETADIALMADKLDNLPFAIGLSRKAKRIIKQNLIISLGMVAILVPLTIMGTIAIGPAVIGHEGSTLVVVLNALRLLKYDQKEFSHKK